MRFRAALKNLQEYLPGKGDETVIKLASNENPLGASPLALQAIEDNSETIFIYPEGDAPDLRAALASKHGLKANQVICGNGSGEIISMVCAAMVQPGFEVVSAVHTFSVYRSSTVLFGGTYVPVEMDKLGISLKAIQGAITEKTQIVTLCNPNNPTGTYFSHDELADFLSNVPKNVLVLIDEAYSEYAQADDFPRSVELLSHHSNLLILHTFSKIYGLAGIRLGYGLGHPKIISNIQKVRLPFNTNKLAQIAGLAALDDEEFVEESITVNEDGKKTLYEELGVYNIEFIPTAANFVCVHIPGKAKEAWKYLWENGYSVRHLASFGLDDYLRITLSHPIHMKNVANLLGQFLRDNK